MGKWRTAPAGGAAGGSQSIIFSQTSNVRDDPRLNTRMHAQMQKRPAHTPGVSVRLPAVAGAAVGVALCSRLCGWVGVYHRRAVVGPNPAPSPKLQTATSSHYRGVQGMTSTPRTFKRRRRVQFERLGQLLGEFDSHRKQKKPGGSVSFRTRCGGIAGFQFIILQFSPFLTLFFPPSLLRNSDKSAFVHPM